MTVSATECAASESIALDPLISPAIAFATAIPRLATAATTTVNVDSPPGALLSVLFSALMVGSIHDGAGRGLFSPAGPGPRPPG